MRSAALFALAAHLGACGALVPIPDDPPAAAAVDSGEDVLADSAPPAPPVVPEVGEQMGSAIDEFPPPQVTEEVVGDHVLDDAWIFTHDVIHEIDLTLGPAAVDALLIDPDAYVQADFEMDGIALGQVGMRLRGKIGSFRALTGKPKIKIDFNRFVPDQRFYGLEALALNNAVVDCGYLREPIAYSVFEAAGAPASRTGFSVVRVNGQPYGLYIVVEVPDDRFLRRSFAYPEGNLYDGKYVWYGGYSYTLLDFGRGVDHLFGLEEGPGAGAGEIADISGAMLRAWSSTDFYGDMDSVIDWDATLLMLAAEQYVGQNDGYAMNTNNYRVYFDPEDGKAELLPWDMDYSSLQDYEWGRAWSSPTGQLAWRCRTDTNCRAAWKTAAEQVTNAADTLDIQGDINTLSTFLSAEALADPRRECSTSYISSYQNALRAFYAGRSAYMRSFWGF
jgi:hypothetical protein